MFKWFVLAFGVLCFSATASRSEQVIFEDRFEGEASPAWSKRTVSKTPNGGRSFLGEFGFDNVRLDLKEVPAHRWVTLSFDVLALRTWDGNSLPGGPEVFSVSTGDGRILVRTNFAYPSATSTQAYPGFHVVHRHAPATGAVESNTLGFRFGKDPCDGIYRITTRFSHSGDTLALFFEAVSDFNKKDESWGLAGVKVTVSDEAPAETAGTLEELWSALGSEDGAVAAKAVQALIDRGGAAVEFLASRLTGTVRPLIAELLLDPAACFVRLPKDGAGEALAPLSPAERQQVMAAFVLQVIGTPNARKAVENWKLLPGAIRRTVVHIRDEEGNPAAMLPVAASERCSEFWSARCDREGRLSLLLPAGKTNGYSLWTMTPEIVRASHDWNPQHSPEPPENVEFVVAKNTTIGGQVLNDAGEPVPDATVVINARRRAEPGRPAVSVSYEQVKTDKEGRWKFSRMAKGMEKISLGVHHPHYPTEWNGGFYQIKEYPSVEELYAGKGVLTLKRGVTITGTVRGAEGQPIANAYVEVGDDIIASNSLPARTTDKEGRYRIAGQPGRALTITVKGYRHAPDLQTVKVGTEPMVVDFSLKRPVVLEGKVVDMAGMPIKGATVFLDTWRNARTLNTRLTTDAEGRFCWDIAPAGEEIKVDVLRQGYADNRKEVVKPGKENVIRLSAPKAITAKVLDAETKAPIETFSYETLIRFSETEEFRSAYRGKRPGKGGAFQTEIGDSYPSFMLRVAAPGYQHADSEAFTVDGKPLELTFLLQKAKMSRMRVVDPEGKPMPGATVLVASEEKLGGSWVRIENGVLDERYDQSPASKFTADAEGFVEVPEEKGAYVIFVLEDKGYAVRYSSAGETGDLKLTPWARLEGMLLFGTRPAREQKIGLHCENFREDRQKPAIRWNHTADTDHEGRFRFERLLAGTVRMGNYVQQGSPGSRSCTYVFSAEAVAGQTTTVTFGGKGRPVSGRFVVPAEFREVPSAVSNISLEEAKPEGGDNTLQGYWNRKRFNVAYDANGVFRAENVDPGTYRLSASLFKQTIERNPRLEERIGQWEMTVIVPEVPNGVSDEPLEIGDVPFSEIQRPKVGAAAPAFSCKDLNGQTVDLAGMAGKYVLLDFWATWCGPCVAELPQMKELYEEFGKDPRFCMVSLSLDPSEGALRKFVAERELGWTQARIGQGSSIASSYGVEGIPSVWLIGPDGKIVAKNLRGEEIAKAIRKELGSNR